jgi:hypothetical protein
MAPADPRAWHPAGWVGGVFGRWERRQPQPGSATQVNAWNNKVLSAMLARQCYAAGPGIVLSEQPEWAGLSAGRHALGFAVGQEPMPGFPGTGCVRWISAPGMGCWASSSTSRPRAGSVRRGSLTCSSLLFFRVTCALR